MVKRLSIPLFVSVILIFIFYKLIKIIKNQLINFSIFTVIVNVVLVFFLNSTLSFTNEPRITSISPQETSEAWTDVTVNGKNFRDLPFVGRIYIDGVEQGVYVISWTDSKVVFRTNPQITKSGMLRLSPLDKKSSNEVKFIYDYK